MIYVAGRLPLPRKNGTKIRVHFFETLYPYENIMSIKKKFHRWTKKLPAKQHSQISPDSDHLGRFGCAAQLVSFLSIDENFFDAHFVFVWVKSFKKVRPNFCSIFSGLRQPSSQITVSISGDFSKIRAVRRQTRNYLNHMTRLNIYAQL